MKNKNPQSLDNEIKKSFKKMKAMTNLNGILQHESDPKYDYSIDDNTRALIVLSRLSKFSGKYIQKDLSEIYLKFICDAKRKDGWFNNYKRETGEWLGRDGNTENPDGLEDCYGRVMWALSDFAFSNYPRDQKRKAVALFKNFLNTSYQIDHLSKYPMTLALTNIAMSKFHKNKKSPQIFSFSSFLAYRLLESYRENSNENWRGFSDEYTYCAARPAQAMILSDEILGVNDFTKAGLESLDFLIENLIDDKGIFNPIGHKGWWKRGRPPAEFNQQPVEAGVMTEACIDAYKISREKSDKEKYLNAALNAFDWYLGKNCNNISLIDKDGGVYDSLLPFSPDGKDGLNTNQGAESVVTYLMALTKFKEIGINPF